MRLFLVIAKRLGSGGGVEDTSSYNTCIRHDVSIDIAISYAIFPPPRDIKRRGKDLPRDRHNRKDGNQRLVYVAKILREKWRRGRQRGKRHEIRLFSSHSTSAQNMSSKRCNLSPLLHVKDLHGR